MYRVISPSKIRALRGTATRRSIVERAGDVISEQELYAYEKETGGYKPSDKKLPYLLKALDCSFEDISEPVDLSVA